jgi:hypothetical protein
MTQGLGSKISPIIAQGLSGPKRIPAPVSNTELFLNSLTKPEQKSFLIEMMRATEYEKLTALVTVMKKISPDFDELNVRRIASGKTNSFIWDTDLILPVLKSLCKNTNFTKAYNDTVVKLEFGEENLVEIVDNVVKPTQVSEAETKEAKAAAKAEREKNKITPETLVLAKKILSPIFGWTGEDKKNLIPRVDFTSAVNDYLKADEALRRYQFRDSIFDTIKRQAFSTNALNEPFAKAVIVVATKLRNELVDQGKLDPAYRIFEPQ